MKRYYLFLFTLFIIQNVFAQPTGSWEEDPVTINGLNYILNEETHEAMLDNGNSWNGDLQLPSRVKYNEEDYTLTRIAWLAFAFCETLTHITIPGTVCEITHYASYEACKNPFVGCTSLEAIEVDEENPSMCSVNGVLFSKDKSHLYSYPAGAKAMDYKVPDDVTWIGGDAFAHNLYLRTVEIPNSVTFMGFGSFSGCRNLESVRLSENIKYLDAYTFDNCESLHVIDIPQNVSGFAESVFRWTHLDALVVRGTFPENLRYDTFYFVSDSMIIYAQPSEISKFKKVFSGTVLPLDEYTNGVNAPQVVKTNSVNYDLSGRKVSGKPHHGLYIKDGKKVIQ